MADQGIELTNAGSQSGGGQRPPVGRPAESYEWQEVKYSFYAISLSYLMMAMRGLNALIFTWSCVVLLGGFVSMLQKKDFWCLTIITLVQVPGLFNPDLYTKLLWVEHLPKGFGVIVPASGLETSRAWHVVGRAAQIAAALVAVAGGIFLILLQFGVPIAEVLSLWRLVQRDYGVAKKDPSKANLTPALDVLYSLVVLHSTLFLLCWVFDLLWLKVAEAVMEEYQVGGSERPLFQAYFAETKMGCCKDPSFAKERNLVTYAVGMMGSDSPTSYVAGVRILGSLFGPQWPLAYGSSRSCDRRRTSILRHRWGVVNHLLTRSSSNGHVVQRLLRTVGPLNPYDVEAREAAARVMRLISSDIDLEQFPQGMRCIASLLQGSEEHRALLIQGLNILYELAADERNRRVMSDTPGLLSMLVAPVSFHANHDAECQEAALKSLYVVSRFLSAEGETDAKLRHQIETDAVSAMESILECDQCRANLQEQVIIVLRLLHFCKQSGKSSNQRRAKFITILVSIFADDKEHADTVRMKAADTLEHLCTTHSGDVEYPLKQVIINGTINGIREVQNKIICCESSGGAEANDQGFSEPSTTDLEANDPGFSETTNAVIRFPNLKKLKEHKILKKLKEHNRALWNRGLNILVQLAADERNCRVMSDTPGLLSMLVAPLSFHADHDVVCQEAALKSLYVVDSLLNAQGETGAKLRHQIETDEQAVSAMESILECDQCRADLQEQVIKILEVLHFCNHSGKASNQRAAKFIRILVSIFAGDKKHEANVRIKAALTLGQICINHSGDVEYPLKEDIINEIRKVQNVLICCESSGAAEANARGFSEPSTTDLEANVVRPISHDINLEQFPQGIRCIASLLEISEEHRALLIHGLKILYEHEADERNCGVMSDTPDRLCMLVAPVSFHANHDAVCQEAALKSLVVIDSLLNAQGETGETDEQAVSAMESILECDQCRAGLQEEVIIFHKLLRFCKHSGKASNQTRAKFIRILEFILAGDKKHEATVRIEAAHTLGHLCTTHSGDVEYPLKEDIINGIRKVCESSGTAKANDRGFSEPSTDLEAQLPSQDNGCNDASSSFNQRNNEQRLVDELKVLESKPHGRHCSKRKQKKYGKGGKHGKRSQMVKASFEEEEEPFL